MTWIIQIKEGETPPGGSPPGGGETEGSKLNLALMAVLAILGLGAGAYIARRK